MSKRKEAELRARLRELEEQLAKKSTTWEQVQQDFAAIYAPPSRAASTWKKHRPILAWLATLAPSPDQVRRQTIAEFVKQYAHGRRPTTINSALRCLRTQCNFLVAEKLIEASPFKDFKFWLREPARADRPRKFLHIEELRELLRQADSESAVKRQTAGDRWRARRLRALLYLGLYTGLRAMELLYLRVDDVDVARQTVKVTDRDHRTKTAGSRDTIPLAPIARDVIIDWLADVDGPFLFPTVADKYLPWVGGSHRYRACARLKALGVRAGVAGVTLLALRHSFVTHARGSWGFTAEEVQLMTRHKLASTQDHYDGRVTTAIVSKLAAADFRRAN